MNREIRTERSRANADGSNCRACGFETHWRGRCSLPWNDPYYNGIIDLGGSEALARVLTNGKNGV